MKKVRQHIGFCFKGMIVVFFFTQSLMAQTPVATSQESVSVTLPEIALLDIEPNNSTVDLALPAPTEAGAMEFSTQANNAKWINYSSAVAIGGSRNVTVQITSGTVPLGIELRVEASNSASGAGQLGSSAGSIILSGSPQLLISNIGGAYTGNGANRGHALSYTLKVTDVAKLDHEASTTLTVSYTLLDI